MIRLNAPLQTPLQRRYLPVMISLVLLGVSGAMLAPPAAPGAVLVPAIVILVMSGGTYFAVYQALIRPVVDSVMLDGDVLRIHQGRRQVSVPVADITQIRSHTWVSPETITFDLATESELGRSITFIPPARFPNSREHPILEHVRATMASS